MKKMKMKKIKILLIDDEIEFTSTLAERLELRGFDAKTTDNGESGIELIRNELFDIAIIDLMMPGISGLETLKQVKTFNTKLPVILLTGHGSTKEGMEGIRIGAVDYLMKPLDINDLLEKIRDILKDNDNK
jgi:DNA-binding response OmpR family regulator